MTVYGLYSPDGELRYIGITAIALEKRLVQHLKPSSLKRSGHKNNWLKSLLAKNELPFIEKIQELNTIDDLNNAEKYWIRYFKELECRLVNETEGGEGLRNPSIDVRKKLSDAKKGKPSWKKGTHLSEETKQKLRRANLGKTHSLEVRHKMSLAHKGRTVSEETKQKLRTLQLGSKRSPEMCRNISIAALEREALKRELKGS